MKDLTAKTDKIRMALLEGPSDFCVSMARKLWAKQTEDEKQMETTVHRNDVGYNSADAPWVGRFLDALDSDQLQAGATEGSAEWIEFEKKLIELRIRMEKYRGQLAHLCTDEEVEAVWTVTKELSA